MKKAPTTARGLGLRQLLIIAGLFALCMPIGRVFIAIDGAASLDDVAFSLLTAGLFFEMLSWCALPIISWFYIYLLQRGISFAALCGWTLLIAAVSEIPYDLVSAGVAVSGDSQNPAWGCLIALIVLGAFTYVQRYSAGVRITLMVAVSIAALFWLIACNIGTRLGIAPLGIITVGFFLIFNYLWRQENRMMLTAGGFGAVMFITPALGVVFLHYRADNLEEAPLPARQWIWAYPALLGIFAVVLHALS